MTTDYGIMSIKLCLEVGNEEYIIVCNFGGRRMKGFEVIVMAELHSFVNLPILKNLVIT